MADTDIWLTATEYRRMSILLAPPAVIGDIVAVGVALRTTPNDVPDPSGAGLGEFTAATLDPTGPDIVVLIGPRDGDIEPVAPGDYQVFVLVRTSDEDIIRRPAVLTVMG
jgi:hypothetical protein